MIERICDLIQNIVDLACVLVIGSTLACALAAVVSVLI